ncbi:hypothetical protein F2P81_019466 [Scophthalmus maximus]|uniref:Uncharacterized protein n=1 Tax=Scophthalmus maximus TaxID=52904 RepID=A0A6A4S754_SCOMX|nr:hypothetical protein F2P81_019466 [Scophthalmus maximus]
MKNPLERGGLQLRSLYKALPLLGISGAAKRKAIKSTMEARWTDPGTINICAKFTVGQPPELYSVTSCRNESGRWGVKPDNALLLDSTSPTVIGCDRHRYVQIGSVISPATQMKARQRAVTYDCNITYWGEKPQRQQHIKTHAAFFCCPDKQRREGNSLRMSPIMNSVKP